MEKIKNNLIISLVVGLFVASVIFLFWSAERPLKEKWWAIYFEDAKNSSLNFVIENHSGEDKFSLVVLKDDEKIIEKELNCQEEKCLIELEDFSHEDGRFMIEVYLNQDKRTIYKNL